MLQPTPGLMRLLGRAERNPEDLAGQIMQRLQVNALQVFPANQGSAHLQLSVAADCRDQVAPPASPPIPPIRESSPPSGMTPWPRTRLRQLVLCLAWEPSGAAAAKADRPGQVI